ncbi:MAG: AAA family ATPase [Candidatus Omnitrophica bacterium]|nr:AAA family ATPase [Candidatus Omnitrophota bacterium]
MIKKFRNIFLSSIHQNAGKTTVSLGLFHSLKMRKIKTAFIKPVGQQFVHLGNLEIDKDSYLIGEVYKCNKKKYSLMSPVTIGKGFTEKYIFDPQKGKLEEKILKSFKGIVSGADAVIVEGTGHAGVGSVIDFSNADVAKLLGSKVIIVSEGGIGKAIDEIILNKALFDLRGVEVLGVILNKVLPEKYDKVVRVVRQGLANKGIKLLGAIPFEPVLSSPTVEQIQTAMDLKLLCGKDNLRRSVKHIIVAAMEPHNMAHHIKDGTLVLVSGDRVDNILLAVSSHLIGATHNFTMAGIILTGGLIPTSKIIDLLEKSGMPVLLAQEDTYSVAAQFKQLTCKIQKTDAEKLQEANRVVKKYVDVGEILKNF